jgi:hypothetical protein
LLLPCVCADIFDVGPGPELQAAFKGPDAGEGAAAALAQLEELRAKADAHTDEQVWSTIEVMAARDDAVGAAVNRWKVEVQDRLLGQYDITALAGREAPKVDTLVFIQCHISSS